jgi:hypothetical protein
MSIKLLLYYDLFSKPVTAFLLTKLDWYLHVQACYRYVTSNTVLITQKLYTEDPMSQLRRLVNQLSPWRPGFSFGLVHVGFLADRVALGYIFLQVRSVFPSHCHSTDNQYLFFFFTTYATESLQVMALLNKKLKSSIQLYSVHSSSNQEKFTSVL